jgi:pimeloyl-ACP methyl ester carboxylesterase
MRVRIVGLALGLLVAIGAWSATEAPGEAKGSDAREAAPRGHVVLLHGLGRSKLSMGRMEDALEAEGYAVTNIDYPGVRATGFAALVAQVRERVATCCAGKPEPVHFVTHSLGGILVRALIDEDRPPNLGRVVMLSPPNQGSEWVDALGEYSLFRTATGPAAQELGTDAEAAPSRLGPVDFPLGVMTGDSSWNPIGSWLIPGDDDGVVAVERARIDGMADFRVVNENHTNIMRSDEVITEAIHFLANERFRPRPE